MSVRHCEHCIQYSSTVAKSGIAPFTHNSNSLINVKNLIKGAVLAEPFPWTVTQGITHVLR